MPDTQTQTHVQKYLSSAGVPARSKKRVSALLDDLTNKRDSWPALKKLENWITLQLKELGVEEADAASDKAVIDLLAVATSVNLQRGILVPASLRTEEVVNGVELLTALEAGFLGELLNEVRNRASKDPVLAARLTDARELNDALYEGALDAYETRPVRDSGDSDPMPNVLYAAADTNPVPGILAIIVITVIWVSAQMDDSKD